ncbi:glycosyltransferase family 4 protein [Vibrio vulnificus]|uniref:glycosyltransferase family 4 protein n=1 Tax=Vibrio vulnificus TaxID=672 RepID=UPI00165E1E00|nr:glycosyltransferase family 4 protein [Vibrio vulnificus]EIT7026117.1 glycosyltransferase family 4 protein [Vibrio vulnificus]
MLNVIVIEDSSKSAFGGGQMVTSYVLEILKNAGCEIHLFDAKTDGIFHDKVKTLVFSCNKLLSFGKIGISSTASFNVSLLEVLLFPFISIFNFFKILKVAMNYKLDKKNSIVYATTKKSLVYTYLLSFIGYRFIYHAHNYDFKSRFFFIYRHLLKRADVVICVSKLVKESINLNNAIFVYNPAPKNKYPKVERYCKDYVDVAFVGGLIDLKGVVYFLSAYDFLTSTNEARFHIYGEGHNRDSLEKEYANDDIIFHGFVDDISYVLNNEVDIVVLPSILEEACPMVIIEALNLGIPVITTNIGGQAELVIDRGNGVLVDIKSPKQIAEAIEVISLDNNIYNNFREKCYESAGEYSPEIFEMKILDAFSLI